MTTEIPQIDIAPKSVDQDIKMSTDTTQDDDNTVVLTSTIELEEKPADPTQNKGKNCNMANNNTQKGSVDVILAPSSNLTVNEESDGYAKALQQIKELQAAATAREEVIDACHDEIIRALFQSCIVPPPSSQPAANDEGDEDAEFLQLIKSFLAVTTARREARREAQGACQSQIVTAIYRCSTIGATDLKKFKAQQKRIKYIKEEFFREYCHPRE